MKKFLIILISAVLMISSLTIFASAKLFTPPETTNVCLAFTNNNIGYPLYIDIDIVEGQPCLYPTILAVYSTSYFEGYTIFNGTGSNMLIEIKRNNYQIEFFYVGHEDTKEIIYEGVGYDVLIYRSTIDGLMHFAIVDSSYNFIRSGDFHDNFDSVGDWSCAISYAESLGITIGYGTNPPPIESGHITDVIFDGLIPFTVGASSAFVSAFTSLFIVNNTLNALAIFILVFFGIALGYGVIRWITGLFRKESK